MSEAVRDMAANSDAKWLLSDFEHDKKSLENYDGSFIWQVRKTGTTLEKCDPILLIRDMKEEQTMRYFVLRNEGKEPYIYDSKDIQFTVYNRQTLIFVSREDFISFYKECYKIAAENFGELFPEIKVVKRPIQVTFDCGLKYVMEQIRFAQSIGDESLLGILRNFRNWPRSFDNHAIRIGKDFTEHGFSFSEYRDGNWGICGGILFYRGKWHTHT